MKQITLPDKCNRRLVFYLAMEEFVARCRDIDEAFFIWQVDPTVIFGRNQLLEAEVNVPFCHEHGIQLYRRKSGGGCVYSDRGTLMLSYITTGNNVGFLFDRYLRRVAMMLQRRGIDAHVDGRNDIMVNGRKVSGNAFYKLPNRCIIHGTLLFNTDFDRLQQAITPSTDKLKSKGVESVRRHVANLCEFTDIDIDTLRDYLVDEMCRGDVRQLTTPEIAKIKEIEQSYLNHDFIIGHNPSYTTSKHGKIAGVGEVTVEMEMKNSRIKRLHLSGDFFPIYEIDNELNRRLAGVECNRNALQSALDGLQLDEYVLNFTTADFIELILMP